MDKPLTKLEFMKRCFKWTAIICMAIAVILPIFVVFVGGHVIEESPLAEYAKWVVMGAVVTCIIETFMYVIGQMVYDLWYRKKHDVPYDGEA